MSFQATSITEALCGLPESIDTGGRTFRLSIFSDNSPTDIRLCYALDDTYNINVPVGERGAWFNPYAGGRQQSFLYLQEGISSDQELVAALLEARAWLIEHDLIVADFGLKS